jgi:beta-N-acetylhexosaminidase
MKTSDAWIRKLVSDMSLEEKIGLTLTVISEGGTYLPANEGLIKDYHCGGLRVVPAVRFNQQVFVDRGKRGSGREDQERFYYSTGHKDPVDISLSQFAGTLQRYREEALASRHGIPLRLAFDQEGGVSRDLTFGGAHIFPPPMGLAASGDPKIAYEAARVIGRMGRAAGLNMIHSPVLDVNVEPDNPEIYTRAYSDVPEVVAEFAAASARGFKETGMIATGKHFPGRGDSTGDAHFEIPVLDIPWDTLWNRDLYPYRVLIEEGLLPVIMTAHSIYPAVDPDEIATLSAPMLQGVLRDKLGYDGVITSDAIGMKGVTLKYDVPDACVKALQAGCDMLLMRMSTNEPIGPVIPNTISRIKAAVENGRIRPEELDAKIFRILRSYDEAGLFENRGMADETVDEVLADPHCCEVAELASRRSVLVARDHDGLLPLAPNRRALVVEQRIPRQFCPNNGHWYAGMFYDHLCTYSNELSYIETGMQSTPEQEELIFSHLDTFDLVIITNWYYRDEIGSNSALVRKIIAAGKKVIVVGDTPYEQFSIPKEAGTAIVQFGVTPISIRAVSEIIFGRMEARAGWPIEYQLRYTESAPVEEVHSK